MRKIVLTYGAISGLIMVGMFIISISLQNKGIITFSNGELIGYSSMIIVLSQIFFGIKSYRDKHGNGAITFGKGVQVGMLIALFAGFIYATSWEVYYNGVPGVKETFMDKYTDSIIAKMENEGAEQEKIDAKIKEMESMKEMYANPFIRYGITLAEILPVGIVIALISAGILRKKNVLPA